MSAETDLEKQELQKRMVNHMAGYAVYAVGRSEHAPGQAEGLTVIVASP